MSVKMKGSSSSSLLPFLLGLAVVLLCCLVKEGQGKKGFTTYDCWGHLREGKSFKQVKLVCTKNAACKPICAYSKGKVKVPFPHVQRICTCEQYHTKESCRKYDYSPWNGTEFCTCEKPLCNGKGGAGRTAATPISSLSTLLSAIASLTWTFF